MNHTAAAILCETTQKDGTHCHTRATILIQPEGDNPDPQYWWPSCASCAASLLIDAVFSGITMHPLNAPVIPTPGSALLCGRPSCTIPAARIITSDRTGRKYPRCLDHTNRICKLLMDTGIPYSIEPATV